MNHKENLMNHKENLLMYHKNRVKDLEKDIAEEAARGILDRQHEVDLEIKIEADRQRNWRAKTPGQQAELLLQQLNKTMRLNKGYGKLSRAGLEWLRVNGHVSDHLSKDLNDEIPF